MNAASVESLNRALKNVELKRTISSGNVSAIVGRRPVCILYKDEMDKYQTLVRCIEQYFQKVNFDMRKATLTVAI